MSSIPLLFAFCIPLLFRYAHCTLLGVLHAMKHKAVPGAVTANMAGIPSSEQETLRPPESNQL